MDRKIAARLNRVATNLSKVKMASEMNPHAKNMTFETFKSRYFGGEQVSNKVAKEFWDDFRYSFIGGLARYIKETTTTYE